MQNLTTTQKLMLLALAWFLLSGGAGGGKPDAFTYFYEKDQGEVPAAIAAALDTLNTKGVLASKFDQDTVDGGGEVPEQYKVPLEAAKKVGLPAGVSSRGKKVVKATKSPTPEQILEVAP